MVVLDVLRSVSLVQDVLCVVEDGCLYVRFQQKAVLTEEGMFMFLS